MQWKSPCFQQKYATCHLLRTVESYYQEIHREVMYLNTTVKIPVMQGKIITKKKGGATYILYQYGS